MPQGSKVMSLAGPWCDRSLILFVSTLLLFDTNCIMFRHETYGWKVDYLIIDKPKLVNEMSHLSQGSQPSEPFGDTTASSLCLTLDWSMRYCSVDVFSSHLNNIQ